MFNVARTCIHPVMHTNALDEALALPPFSAHRRNTQLVLQQRMKRRTKKLEQRLR